MLKIVIGITNISGSSTPYELPQATASALGGIKADEKTENETVEVKINTATGKLFAPAGSVGMINPMIAEGDLIIGGVNGVPDRLASDNIAPRDSQSKILTYGGQGFKWHEFTGCSVVIANKNGTLGVVPVNTDGWDDYKMLMIHPNTHVPTIANIFDLLHSGATKGLLLTSYSGWGESKPVAIELGDDGQVLTSDKNNAGNVAGIAWKAPRTPSLNYENAVAVKDNTLATPVDLFPYTPPSNGILKIISNSDVVLETTETVLPNNNKDNITLTTSGSVSSSVTSGVEWLFTSGSGTSIKIFFIPYY